MKLYFSAIALAALTLNFVAHAQQELTVQPIDEEIPDRIDVPLHGWTQENSFLTPDLGAGGEDVAPSFPETRAAPDINSKSDLLNYLLGDQALFENDGAAAPPAGGEPLMPWRTIPFQVVPGIDDDLGNKFPELVDFIANFPDTCRAAAAKYADYLQQITAPDSNASSADDLDPETSSVYDALCMKQIDDVPDDLLRVTGILTIGGRPFCSATAIDENKIITALHCFYRDDMTEKPVVLDGLKNNRVVIKFFKKQGFQSAYDVTLPNGWTAPTAAITGHNDILVLNTTGPKLKSYVTTPAGSLDPDNIPRTAWLIGSNNLISDLGSNKPIEEYARAAPPETCAVIYSSNEDCLVHSCQSGPSTSGGGLIGITDAGERVLVGVHRGPIGVAKDCTIDGFKGRSLNVAARYN